MIEINGVDGLLQGLKNLDEDFEEEFEKETSNLTYEFLEKLVERTPVQSRNEEEVRENWIIGPLLRDEEGWHIQIYNNSQFAKNMEYGYRTTDVSGNTTFVPGNHMKMISLREINSNLDSELVKWLKNFWKGEFNGNL